jgi:alkylhydroperoxidase/carboxymuconolactone decarboxylase family protein YurZ
MITSKELAQKAADLRDVIDRYLPASGGGNSVYADAERIGTELQWGGIWNEPGLDHTLRSIATITAQAVNGFDMGLRHQCRVGLSLGIPPQTIKAMILELRFWIGNPNTVIAFRMLQEVINEREEWKARDVPVDGPWLATVEESARRWLSLWRGVGAFTAQRQRKNGQHTDGIDEPRPHETAATSDRVCVECRFDQA